MSSEPIRLGMVRLTDAAPLVWAQAKGSFEAAGLDVSVSVEPSWANIADKLAWGALDGAVMLHSLAIAMALGLRGAPVLLTVPAGISRNGNAVTLATRLADAVLSPGRNRPEEVAARLRSASGLAPLRLAVVHAFSTHDLLLRRFLASGGIHPDTDVEVGILPPPDMPMALQAGRIDGFCVGAPWSAVADAAGVGRTVALGSAIWPDHPEKCLALRRDWAQAHPERARRLLEALAIACAACDDPAVTPALADLLALPLRVDADLIAGSLPGGQKGTSDRSRFTVRLEPGDGALLLDALAERWPMPVDAASTVAALYGMLAPLGTIA